MPTAPAARRLLFSTVAAAASAGATGCLHVVRDRPAVPSSAVPCVPDVCGSDHLGPAAPLPPSRDTWAPPPATVPAPLAPAPAPPPPAVERYEPLPPAAPPDAGDADTAPPPPAPLLAPAGFTRIAAPPR